MEQKAVMVELGCGKTKHEGYIGIDRFSLPGVDIVADLNKTIPMADNSVDVILACHSLEHLDDLENIMREIYRVCRHKAVVNIIAPYGNLSPNAANPYHKILFNEHTFRFFTTSPQFVYKNEFLEAPTVGGTWGLSESDNSVSSVDFRTLHMEFLYFHEYNGCDDTTLQILRQNFSNICHMIIYTLAVWKEPEEELTDNIAETLKKTGRTLLSQTRLEALKNHWSTVQYQRPNVYKMFADKIDSLEKKYNLLSRRLERESFVYSQNEYLTPKDIEEKYPVFYKVFAKYYDKNLKRRHFKYSLWTFSAPYLEYSVSNPLRGNYLFFCLDIESECEINVEAVGGGDYPL